MRRAYFRHTQKSDDFILAAVKNRGKNTNKSVAYDKIAKAMRKEFNCRVSAKAVENRYRGLVRGIATVKTPKPIKPTTTQPHDDFRAKLVDYLNTRDYTVEVRGKEVHVVFK